MNLNTINGFLKTEEAGEFAKEVEFRASGAQLFVAPTPTAAKPGFGAPTR